ncbi:unnamed protein product [Acanthoscelides obtectus]|uniref:Retrotransposon gag domain-containing protein n=1 Tax=Acanthoscelides obtectus TaxID=200917 RepID=A0A9P0PRF3_ACAOB|nr:unnamed protein product [Acanthoscelides obtectus]CAK1663495.1 hypothetical protein AOBTE_LOCUS23707 [Acanthoscelides obtectus]
MAPKKPKANVNEENSLLGSLDESESPQCSELKNMVNNLADDFKRLQTSLSGGSRQYVGLWRDLGGHTLTFVPNGPVHPMNFLRKIMHILDEAGVPETARLKLVTGCLRGSAAEWAEIKEDSFDSFQSFIDAFMDRYWGVKEQRALYYEIKYGKFRSGSRADYVLRMAKLASFLTDKISESELVRFLSQHFTQEPEIHRAVLIQNMKTIEELEGFLRNLDEVDATSRDRRNEGRGGYNPPNHNGNRNFRQDAQGENNRNDQDRAIRFIDVGEDLLSEIEDGGDGDEGHQMISSTVKGNVYGEEVNILLDSGSQCCAISDEFYKKINSDENGILVLPVNMLVKKCGLVGTNAVSCIIDGLPIPLQANAKAGNYESPDELFYGFLSKVESFRESPAKRMGTTENFDLQPSTSGQLTFRKVGYQKFGGPYKIKKVLGNDRYEITSLEGLKGYKRFRAIVAADSLREWKGGVVDITESESEVNSTDELIDLLEG